MFAAEDVVGCIPRFKLGFIWPERTIPEVCVFTRHSDEESASVTIRCVRVEVRRLPRSEVDHKVKAVSEPNFLLPGGNLRCATELHQGMSREVWGRLLVVVVNVL